ncbi:MAG: hypothetical protein H6718_19530 [Polyangiaceae bacterium]|nr:hypothetical protein [Polyangiaceae bacterium]MCB9605600.1 hypothetical protein [Polyangiaceae bacterium]
MSWVRACFAVAVLTGCGSSVDSPATAPIPEARASSPSVFGTANDVRVIEATAPIPVGQPQVVSPLPNQPRLPANLAGFDFGRPIFDSASGCLVPAKPLTYEGQEGETTLCSSAPARMGASTPEVILYALSGTVNGMLFTYPNWQSAVAVIPDAYGDPTITEGEDEREREVPDFRGETTRKAAWDVENGRVVLFFEDDAWHLLFAYRD